MSTKAIDIIKLFMYTIAIDIMKYKIKKHIIVTNRQGLHLREAAGLVDICKKYNSSVTISCRDCKKVDACSILNVLMLGARRGDTLTITANGKDADEVVFKIHEYFLQGGGI
ncbi:MAG: HPr family phosphocarrier protein [Elusimicrobia bacterium]|nr:HPr family phosphocarrier protein [Elusimicrobiota bacterium]